MPEHHEANASLTNPVPHRTALEVKFAPKLGGLQVLGSSGDGSTVKKELMCPCGLGYP